MIRINCEHCDHQAHSVIEWLHHLIIRHPSAEFKPIIEESLPPFNPFALRQQRGALKYSYEPTSSLREDCSYLKGQLEALGYGVSESARPLWEDICNQYDIIFKQLFGGDRNE